MPAWQGMLWWLLLSARTSVQFRRDLRRPGVFDSGGSISDEHENRHECDRIQYNTGLRGRR